ncbi:MAG TPA: aminopeptidase [Solimonas sp.]|nr:aminopeptidase [Solimonas sp.]
MHASLKAALLAAALCAAGCGSNLGYYSDLAQGQYGLLRARQPIDEILADAQASPKLKERLRLVQEARRWASVHLLLPDNGSYTSYADLQRPYVVWNVFAAPELSLEPVQHCFLVVGCLAYRGYFDKAMAEATAAQLRAEGYDVHVGGVPAYSTLGWFDDPVTNTMMRWSDEQVVGTLFHELSHQLLYVKDDTVFDESFAQFVEDQGLEQFLRERGTANEEHLQRRERQQQFVQLVLAARDRLDQVYRSSVPKEDKRTAKAAAFVQLREDYVRLRDQAWGGFAGYEPWFQQGQLNNAKLLPFALYDQYKPAFAALFAQQGGDWSRFYAAARRLGEMPAEQRHRELEHLLARARPE